MKGSRTIQWRSKCTERSNASFVTSRAKPAPRTSCGHGVHCAYRMHSMLCLHSRALHASRTCTSQRTDGAASAMATDDSSPLSWRTYGPPHAPWHSQAGLSNACTCPVHSAGQGVDSRTLDPRQGVEAGALKAASDLNSILNNYCMCITMFPMLCTAGAPWLGCWCAPWQRTGRARGTRALLRCRRGPRCSRGDAA
jgi:hypothetical protein